MFSLCERPQVFFRSALLPFGGTDNYPACTHWHVTALCIFQTLSLHYLLRPFRFPQLFPQLSAPSRWTTWLFPRDLKWAYSIIYVINWFWKPTCILYDPTLILPRNPPTITLQFISMTDWGHYLGNESLAAPSGVVEALDEERQELPPDQLPSGDDPGSLPADTGVPV